MLQDVHIIRRVLRSSALCGVLAIIAAPALTLAFDPNADTSSTSSRSSTGASFNPNAGAEPASKASTLPSTAPLIGNPSPKLVFTPSASTVPPFASVVPEPALSPMAAMAAPLAGESRTPVAMPEPVAAAAPVAVAAPSPNYPPVDPAVMAQAQQEMNAKRPSYIAPAPSFTPPAPLAAAPVKLAPVATAPVAMAPLPQTTAPAVATAPDAGLSTSSKAILHRLPAKLSTTKAPATGKLDVSRMSPAVKPIADDKVQSYDAVGLSIKVARPGLDTNFELNRAYTALMGGDTETAITTYKNILASDPTNQDALFGLAATYHRSGRIDQARPYYGELLKVNPTHREGLNNFLALVSEESPNEALVELERLEQKNPDFSPIPAQESIVLNKLGYADQARDKLLRAIELAPDNMTYKYNLAILFDSHGDYVDASTLYHQLIEASLNGEKLPASTETLQKRLNYISAAAAASTPTGN